MLILFKMVFRTGSLLDDKKDPYYGLHFSEVKLGTEKCHNIGGGLNPLAPFGVHLTFSCLSSLNLAQFNCHLSH